MKCDRAPPAPHREDATRSPFPVQREGRAGQHVPPESQPGESTTVQSAIGQGADPGAVGEARRLERGRPPGRGARDRIVNTRAGRPAELAEKVERQVALHAGLHLQTGDLAPEARLARRLQAFLDGLLGPGGSVAAHLSTPTVHRL